MSLSLQPVRIWNATISNRCAFEQIPVYWKDYDTLTFLVNLDIWQPSFSSFLDHQEKAQELRYKTDVSRKRFVVSRTILKHILKRILPVPALSEITLIRKKYGGIHIKDVPGMHISLSYSGPWIAITAGKRKIGTDIEVLRPVDIKKTRSCPLFSCTGAGNGNKRIRHFLWRWTLVEACAKFRDRSMYACLTENDFPPDVDFVSYCINSTAVFSLACCQDHGKDILLWLDTADPGIGS